MVNHLSYDPTSHRLEVRFILDRDLPIRRSAFSEESNVAGMLQNITAPQGIFINGSTTLLCKNNLYISSRQGFNLIH
jgi:hypothetical protein